MERLTKRIGDSLVVFTQGRYGKTIPAEMDNDDIRMVLEKMADYEEAEEQGLLLRLPCAIGSTIYKIEYPTIFKEDETEWKVLDKKRATIEPLKFALCHLRNIGYLYFLTREEAEAALEKMR